MSRILLVLHQQHSTPGRIGELLMQRGHELQRCCPSIGDALPDDLDNFDACVVFGGPQSANDCHLSAIRAELDWLEQRALPAQLPLLGICLGAQLMARVLGARVGPPDDALVEIGYKTVHATTAGRDFMAGAECFYQWHSETFEIPDGAVHLAHNDDFAGQAFAWGEQAWAIEFHPEMTLEMVNRWCTSDGGSKKLALRGAQAHADQLEDFARHAPQSDQWLTHFFDRYLLK